MRVLWLLLPLLSLPLSGDRPIRIGLDTEGLEWVLSGENGGEIAQRDGKAILRWTKDEKIRVWWDSDGKADPTSHFRVQVGPPIQLKHAKELQKKLQVFASPIDLSRVADGETYRVLLGTFPSTSEADPLLEKLRSAGYHELWIALEDKPSAVKRGKGLYAITEQYERIPLPREGVWIRPKGELTKIEGKGRYRGRIEILPNAKNRLSLVNTLPLESYLRGVVPKEMGVNEYPALEALKAQAIAARTYAFANLGKRNAEGFDLLDTVQDQVYGGRDGEQALSDRAIQETEGLIATFKGKPIQALFMACGGGATVDVSHVFGGDAPYLKGVSSYPERPLQLTFQSHPPLPASLEASWLSLELLRLVGSGLVPIEWMSEALLNQAASGGSLEPILQSLARSLALPPPAAPPEKGAELFLWMARSLGFHRVVEGLEQPTDARYFLAGQTLLPEQLSLATFLLRRGHLSPADLNGFPTLLRCLQCLGRLWQELEPFSWNEGTLLRDGQVRRKRGGPEPFPLASSRLVLEEYPNGSLRLVPHSQIQVGDRLKWFSGADGARVLIRRLDPDGASWDRYNPVAHWRVELSQEELEQKLRAKTGLKGLKNLLMNHNAQGRVLELIAVDEKDRHHRFTGMRIRLALGLKDNVFRVLPVGSGSHRRWIFYGRGWGHGVGMDQTGAYGMALDGWTHDRILKHYYTGIQLEKIR